MASLEPSGQFFKIEEFVPSLRQVIGEGSLDPHKLIAVAVPVRNPDERPLVPAGGARSSIMLVQGENHWHWETDSLRALFRGDKQPPVLGAYPEAYNDSFAVLDLHALEFSKFFGDRRDSEMKEIFSMLRRRPDGKSLGFAHDYMWQAAALVLGTQPLSQAEFETIMARLERSCRTFEQGSTSRNYIAAMKTTYIQ